MLTLSMPDSSPARDVLRMAGFQHLCPGVVSPWVWAVWIPCAWVPGDQHSWRLDPLLWQENTGLQVRQSIGKARRIPHGNQGELLPFAVCGQCRSKKEILTPSELSLYSHGCT